MDESSQDGQSWMHLNKSYMAKGWGQRERWVIGEGGDFKLVTWERIGEEEERKSKGEVFRSWRVILWKDKINLQNRDSFLIH